MLFRSATSIPEIDENINMGAEDFVPSRDIIEFVMDLRGCDEDEAKAFIALGMSLHLSVAELNSNFTVYDSDCCYYKAAGRSYYIGTEEMLKDALRAVMDENEDHYKWCWVEAVQAKRTELGFEDWFEEVIKNPQNELDAWDGCGDYQTIEDDEYCICRA